MDFCQFKYLVFQNTNCVVKIDIDAIFVISFSNAYGNDVGWQSKWLDYILVDCWGRSSEDDVKLLWKI